MNARRTGWRWMAVAACAGLLLGGCKAAECAAERLPAQGNPRTTEQLFELVQYAARNDCTSSLYDALSARTRAKHSYTKIWLFFGSIEIPEPYEYKLIDVLRGGLLLGAFPGPGGEELMYVAYKEPGRPDLVAQILVLEEPGPDGQPVRRLAVEEQVASGPPFAQPAAVPTGG